MLSQLQQDPGVAQQLCDLMDIGHEYVQGCFVEFPPPLGSNENHPTVLAPTSSGLTSTPNDVHVTPGFDQQSIDLQERGDPSSNPVRMVIRGGRPGPPACPEDQGGRTEEQ